ncbi:MAG TPA: hypothetical protein VHL14_08925 [Steroidobacteraceae bacterium]|jgi:cytochrome c peroxidase|nr:hypothetical protein [Steroidobacteraceae bacterium]
MKQKLISLCLLAGILTLSTAANADNQAAIGKLLFDLPAVGGNGRACATCHVENDHLVLKPDHIASLPPSDPLFRRIDADDPNATKPTYDHVRAGLIRVVLPLAQNLDVIDINGNVITNAERTITVWRGVPTIENTAITAPYQYDGRAPTYQVQAADALKLHAQVPFLYPDNALNVIAAFESTVFSSTKIRTVAKQLAAGAQPVDPDVTRVFPPGSDEAAGQALFVQGCALCHGGARGNEITSQAAHDQTFFALNPDGTPVFDAAGPVLSGTHQNDVFMNIGTSVFSYLTQPGTGPILGLPGPFTPFTYIDQFPDRNTLDLPHYRIRFYTDATRRDKVVDLPPLPTQGLSPSFVPQAYSVDPGRCIISGDPADYESFKAPQLRGIAHTAPYFHDGSMKTLEDVVEFYSSRVFVFVTAANLPPIYPTLSAGGVPESLSPLQKKQLVKFLKTL